MPDNSVLTPAQMWSVPQTAEYLGISEVAVRKAITQRKLHAVRVGKFYRIDPADVHTYISLDSDPTGSGAE